MFRELVEAHSVFGARITTRAHGGIYYSGSIFIEFGYLVDVAMCRSGADDDKTSYVLKILVFSKEDEILGKCFASNNTNQVCRASGKLNSIL